MTKTMPWMVYDTSTDEPVMFLDHKPTNAELIELFHIGVTKTDKPLFYEEKEKT